MSGGRRDAASSQDQVRGRGNPVGCKRRSCPLLGFDQPLDGRVRMNEQLRDGASDALGVVRRENGS
jgi:hypothetical protein